LICYITAAGNGYDPLLGSSDPAVRRVFGQGVREAVDLRIAIVSFPSAKAEIFIRHCDTVPIPAVVSNRETEGCQSNRQYYFVMTMWLVV
jgi:hypothetical protein